MDVGCLKIPKNPFLRSEKNQYIRKKSDIIRKNEKSGGGAWYRQSDWMTDRWFWVHQVSWLCKWTVFSIQIVWQRDMLIANNNQLADFPGFAIVLLPTRHRIQARREQVRKYAIAYLWVPKKCLFVKPIRPNNRQNFNKNLTEDDDLATIDDSYRSTMSVSGVGKSVSP